MQLFDTIEREHIDWRPQEPPSLEGIHDIELDCETNGLQWWNGDRPIGFAVGYGDQRRYLPFGHLGGGNLDEETVKRWARRELRGKHITNLNTRFDVHHMYAWGVDLEDQGCTVSDVGHFAGLLDDHRLTMSLESIARDYLSIGKFGADLDKTRMATYHAGEVAAYAERDVELVHLLKQVMWPRLTAEGLHNVRQLEDDLIYVVCEMERNGAPLDVELLNKWVKESEQVRLRCLWQIHRETSMVINPNSRIEMERLFHHLKLPLSYTKEGNASFTGAILRSIDHPVIQLVVKALQIASIQSKYLLKYQRTVDSNGILRYALHQMKAQKDESDTSAAAGTISGRFSSTEIDKGVGVNIQQVMKVGKQRVQWGYDEEDDTHDNEIFVIRQLFKTTEGLWLSSDANQIEYRLFANEVNSPRINAIYDADPDTSFHRMMHGFLKPYAPDLTYKRQKDLNFASIYGAGIKKKALMLGFISSADFEMLTNSKASNSHPMLASMQEIQAVFDRELPEAPALLAKCQQVAETRGFIKTIEGRRARFMRNDFVNQDGILTSVYTGHHERSHKALNARIQGSAADINKRKLVEVHRARKKTGFKMFFTVHDELDGMAPNAESARMVNTILNHQSYRFRIPITWNTEVGANWKNTSQDFEAQFNTLATTRAALGYTGGSDPRQ